MGSGGEGAEGRGWREGGGGGGEGRRGEVEGRGGGVEGRGWWRRGGGGGGGGEGRGGGGGGGVAVGERGQRQVGVIAMRMYDPQHVKWAPLKQDSRVMVVTHP